MNESECQHIHVKILRAQALKIILADSMFATKDYAPPDTRRKDEKTKEIYMIDWSTGTFVLVETCNVLKFICNNTCKKLILKRL